MTRGIECGQGACAAGACDEHRAPPEQKRGLCIECSALPDDAGPVECICEWCLIRHYQNAWNIMDRALAQIATQAAGYPEATIAAEAMAEARGMPKDTFKPQAALKESEGEKP